MFIFIFLFLPIFVFNLYLINLTPEDPFNTENTYFLKSNENEYKIIYPAVDCLFYYYFSYLIRMDSKTDKVIYDKIIFLDAIYFFKSLGNNVNIYTFEFYSLIEKNGKNTTIEIGKYSYTIQTYYLEQTYSCNSIFIGALRYLVDGYGFYFELQLYLIKEPYNEISKTLITKNFQNPFKLIGLRDCFVFVDIEQNNKFPRKANYTYKIFDLNLNHINSITVKYTNFSDIFLSQLSENTILNEFIICIKYYESIAEYQIVQYKNLNLFFLETYTIFYPKSNSTY